MSWEDKKLPGVCRQGGTHLERKLLYYYDRRTEYPFELRLRDSTLWGPEDMPNMEHPFDFVPLWEIAMRVFMFKTKTDRERARRFVDGTVKTTKRKRSKSRNRLAKKSRK